MLLHAVGAFLACKLNLRMLVALFRAMFPIEKSEMKKVFLLCLLKFLITHVACILSTIKFTGLITARSSSPEVLPVLKVLVVIPISVFFFWLYTKLTDYFAQSTIFYMFVTFCLVGFLLYGFVLCPNASSLSPERFADKLCVYLGGRYPYVVALFRYWVYVLFYVLAELWGKFILVMLFWGFANSVCTISEAKRFYALFLAIGHIGMLTSGLFVLFNTKQDWLVATKVQMSYVVVVGVFVMLVYWMIDRHVKIKEGAPEDLESVRRREEKKPRLSFFQTLKLVVLNPYLRHVATVVISCCIAMDLYVSTFESYMRENFSNPSNFQVYQSKLTSCIGVVVFFVSFFLGGTMIRRFGWRFAASVPLVIVGLMGGVFFFMSYARNSLSIIQGLFGGRMSWYIMLFGSVYHIMAKTVKYSFYDETIQMAYIPLDRDMKLKCKAAIDVLSTRIGSGFDAWLQIVLLNVFHTSNIQTCSGVLLVVLLVIVGFWYNSIVFLDKQLLDFDRKNQASS